MIFYIPSSTKYVNILDDHGVNIFQIFNEDGKQIDISKQNGDPTLEVHEYISYGRIIEVWRQIKSGNREYNPYAIF